MSVIVTFVGVIALMLNVWTDPGDVTVGVRVATGVPKSQLPVVAPGIGRTAGVGGVPLQSDATRPLRDDRLEAWWVPPFGVNSYVVVPDHTVQAGSYQGRFLSSTALSSVRCYECVRTLTSDRPPLKIRCRTFMRKNFS
ncbi:hypothetical protein I5745_00405 [Burkholderia seminalis]|nr:hypothetical protein [Burkholderia seminalis]